MDIETYRSHGLHVAFGDLHAPGHQVNGRSNREIMDALATTGDNQYHPCAEAHPSPDVPRGAVKKFADWRDTRVYRGTVRDVWIYTPAQFDPNGQPPSLMVFQDGAGYLGQNGPVRATAVLDSLRHSGELPPTIGVFVMPGRAEGEEDPLKAQRQRSVEYDSCSDTYVRFLLQDLLPVVERHVGCKLSSDPAQRAIVGISSGGICAFNAAWHRPDAFGLVLSHCGSFTNIRGGNNYPYLIRSTARKALRVYLTSGAGDANIILGSWPLANQQVAGALEYAGYPFQFAFGEGGHNLRHGGALFSESLRWLWQVPKQQ